MKKICTIFGFCHTTFSREKRAIFALSNILPDAQKMPEIIPARVPEVKELGDLRGSTEKRVLQGDKTLDAVKKQSSSFDNCSPETRGQLSGCFNPGKAQPGVLENDRLIGGILETRTEKRSLPEDRMEDLQKEESRIISKKEGDELLAQGKAILGRERTKWDGPPVPLKLMRELGVDTERQLDNLLADVNQWSQDEKDALYSVFSVLQRDPTKTINDMTEVQKSILKKLRTTAKSLSDVLRREPQKESDKAMDKMKEALGVFAPNTKIIDEKTGKERPVNAGDKFAAVIKLIFWGIQYLQAIGKELSGTKEIPLPREGGGAGPKPGPAEKERERPPQQTRNQEQIASERRQTQERMGAIDTELELEKKHGALLKDFLDSFKRTEGDLAKMLGPDSDPVRTKRHQERQQRLQKQIEEVTKDIAALTKEKGELQKKLDELNGVSGGLEAHIPLLNAALEKVFSKLPSNIRENIGGFEFAVTEKGVVVRLKAPRGFLHELFPSKNEVSIDEIQQRTKEKTEESKKPEAKQELVMERLADRLKDKFERMMEPGKRQDKYATVRNGIRLEAVRDGKFQVYFDFALLQGRLTPVAVQSIKSATRNIRETPGNPVTVTRYTDPLTKEEISAKFGIGGV